MDEQELQQKLAEKDKELFNFQIKTMSDGIKRVEDLLTDMKKVQEKEYEHLQKEINSVKNEYEKKIAALAGEQEDQKLDYTKFKTKVLTWAAAGSLIGGVIVKLAFK